MPPPPGSLRCHTPRCAGWQDAESVGTLKIQLAQGRGLHDADTIGGQQAPYAVFCCTGKTDGGWTARMRQTTEVLGIDTLEPAELVLKVADARELIGQDDLIGERKISLLP